MSRLRGADAVWVSTPALATALVGLRKDARVIANVLDERLWTAFPPATPPRQGPVRVLFMGTTTHEADFAIVEPALARIKAAFGDHVAIDLLGVSARRDLPAWVNRVGMPANAAGSYAGFANWITQQHWDIGIAPLADAVQSMQVGDQDAGLCDHRHGGAGLGPGRLPRLGADGPGGWCRTTWYVVRGTGASGATLPHRRLADERAAVAGCAGGAGARTTPRELGARRPTRVVVDADRKCRSPRLW